MKVTASLVVHGGLNKYVYDFSVENNMNDVSNI